MSRSCLVGARRHLSLVWLAASTSLLTSACAGGGASIAAPGADTLPPPVRAGSAALPRVLSGAALWVDAGSAARLTADQWRASRPTDAADMDKVASQPRLHWLATGSADVRADAAAAVSRMSAASAVPVLVAYNIPQRDCGGLSGGNGGTASSYRAWIADVAAGIGARRAAVILEPDALPGMDCLSAGDQQQRLDLIAHAVTTLARSGTISVYIDAGNPRWRSASTMAARLARAGIDGAEGFALNIANFVRTSENVSYGQALSALVGGKHFIIDTGRNGAGPASDGGWCNPAGRALGERPSSATGIALVDAFLWVKVPGESDGTCNGGSPPGQFMPEYALGLAQRAGY